MTKNLFVTVGDEPANSFSYTTGSNSKSDMQYLLETFDFTATGSQTVLTFASGDTGSPYGPVIADVSATAQAPLVSPTPEPGGLLLLGTGLATLAGLVRRKLAA